MTALVLVLLNLAAPLVVLGVLAKFILSPRRGLLRDLPAELSERLGGLPAEARAKLAGRPVLWVHAASAGEVGVEGDEGLDVGRRVHRVAFGRGASYNARVERETGEGHGVENGCQSRRLLP